MSGAEVVGLALGALPLIIKAIGQYEIIMDPIITYRKYSTALQTFMTELNVQRDIFHNECIWLISRFVDGHALQDMLKDPSHDLRTQITHDKELQRNVARTIGSSAPQLNDVLKLIIISLDDIYEEVKDLPNGLARPQREADDGVDLKAWRSHVKQKLKLGLRKESLNQKVNDLRLRNQAFLALSKQIIRFNASWVPAEKPQEAQSAEKTLVKIEKLRNASCMLFHHLEKLSSCSAHLEHSTNLRLCLETSELYLDVPPKMAFEMAVTTWDVDLPTAGHQIPALLAIESAIETTTFTRAQGKATIRFAEQQEEQFEPAQIQRQHSAGIQKRENERRRGGRSGKLSAMWKKIRGNEEQTASAQSSHNLPDRTVTKLPTKPAGPEASQDQQHPAKAAESAARESAARESAARDLGSVNDLCTHIVEVTKPIENANKCIGFLPGQGTDRYLVYKRANLQFTQGGASNLSKLIASHRRQQIFPKPDKWRVAGALCLAVLLYHSTPWLQTQFQSDDILFFGPSNHSQLGSLKYPHLHAFRRKSKAAHQSQLAKDGYVKNQMLHCLGVILLELEFEDTLESLVAESSLDSTASETSLPPPPTLMHHLLFLKRRAGTQLGTLYGRIVRMCLDCDFGLGLDEYSLDDPRVQKVFYSQVIRPFQERMPEYSKIWADD
ncbi:uncharacterized protein KY384_007514 [Bacidia gigantensis]|uniref:uncharacterized protein n=1 Tax=Bacidia gigantensis TaxID=2732470 RepID=UPI001D03AE7C|nr:uncharacterized protein KY384_007514 [Bacidia gigantensis]KAG8527362.1 hypothetical protein KY384_007514 [Bacidia gigantensis]